MFILDFVKFSELGDYYYDWIYYQIFLMALLTLTGISVKKKMLDIS